MEEALYLRQSSREGRKRTKSTRLRGRSQGIGGRSSLRPLVDLRGGDGLRVGRRVKQLNRAVHERQDHPKKESEVLQVAPKRPHHI